MRKFNSFQSRLRRRAGSGTSRRRNSLTGAHQLEERRLLATLNNSGVGRQEAFLDVDVNEYGAFGNAEALDVARDDIPDPNAIGNAFFDIRDSAPPTPPIESVGYAYESAIAIGTNFRAPGYTREFLTAGCVNYRPTRFNELENTGSFCGDIREGHGYTAGDNRNDAQFEQFSNPPQGVDNRTSTFYYPNGSTRDNAEIRVTLEQELIEHEYLGGPSGTSLVQTYELEILSAGISELEIVRYMDADVYEPGSPVDDGGGHRLIGVTIDQDAVFTTDDATNTPLNDFSIVEVHENHTDFGGYPQLGTNRWEIGRATGNDANGFDFNLPWPLVCVVPCKTHPWLDIWPVETYRPPNANGDAIKPRAFPITQESPYLVARIMAGAPLANDITVNGGWTGRDFNGNTNTFGTPGWDTVVPNYDADDNDVIDRGVPADVAMAMSNQYINVNQGDRIVYQVFTKFGHPPIGTPPPVPTTADLSGRVFADLNGNGVFDTGEQGLRGWTVFNDRNGDGDIDIGEDFVRTLSDGTYLIKLEEGTGHNIALLPAPNWQQTVPLGVGITAPGSYGPIDVTMNDLGTRLMPGNYGPPPNGFPNFDFGVDPDPATIFGTVFNDENANQVFDPTEMPLADWEVFIDLNGDGIEQPGEVILTDVNGYYEMTDLDPGTYTVFSTPQTDYEETLPGNSQYTVTVGAGDTIASGDFGFRFIRGFISGVKFHDLNGDGVRDSNEPPLSDILIYLDLTNDGILNLGDRSSRTDSLGRWSFNNVPPNREVIVAESLPLGMFQTAPVANGGKYLITLAPGEQRTDLEFGNRFISVDYGDAPAPFPTSIQSNGAAHEVDPDVRIGATVTADTVPAINATASGDASDDGVTLIGSLATGATGTIQVTANQAGGFLQGWIDFNGNNSWADPGEQIFSNRSLAAGVNTLTFAVPANAVPGATFARFRYGTQTNIGLTGLASDGEVEDYQFTINGIGGGVPATWTNPINEFDVDADGNVTLSDAFAIISSIRAGGARALSPPTVAVQPPPWLDVNRDSRVSISDALAVLRQVVIARSGSPEGPSANVAKTESVAADKPGTLEDPLPAEGEVADDALLAEMSVTEQSSGANTLADDDDLDSTIDLFADDVSDNWDA